MGFARLVLLLLLQQTISSASLSGVIQDSTGAAIPSVVVTVTNLDRNQTVNTETDARGRFRFGYLPVGEYKIDVQRVGFAPYSTKLTLTIGQTLDIPIALSVAGLSSEVGVTSELPTVEVSRT